MLFWSVLDKAASQLRHEVRMPVYRLSTRAIHIEISPSLIAEPFTNILRGFACHRGHPNPIQSENGSNLVGRCSVSDAIRELNDLKMHFYLRHRSMDISTHHKPATQEACRREIRSTRRIFNADLSSQTRTHDLWVTLMAEVEFIINSHPLIPILLDPDDKERLTPNHLLLIWSSTAPYRFV